MRPSASRVLFSIVGGVHYPWPKDLVVCCPGWMRSYFARSKRTDKAKLGGSKAPPSHPRFIIPFAIDVCALPSSSVLSHVRLLRQGTHLSAAVRSCRGKETKDVYSSESLRDEWISDWEIDIQVDSWKRKHLSPARRSLILVMEAFQEGQSLSFASDSHRVATRLLGNERRCKGILIDSLLAYWFMGCFLCRVRRR